MRLLDVMPFLAVGQLLAILTWANPIALSFNAPRGSYHCTNDPTRIVGQPSKPRPHRRHDSDVLSASSFQTPPSSSNPLFSRSRTEVVWCRYPTNTFILLTMNHMLKTDNIALLLQQTAGVVQDTIAHHGQAYATRDGITWVIKRSGREFTFRAWNEYNHLPMRWTEINDVLFELYDYMMQNFFGTCTFVIYNGRNVIGRGRIGVTPKSI